MRAFTNRKLQTHCQKHALTVRNPVYKRWVLQYTFGEMKKDLGSGDITTALFFDKPSRARAFVIAKENGVLAGAAETDFFLKRIKGIKFRFLKKDGSIIKKKERVLELAGDVRLLMQAERAILNLLGRMSGVASFTRRIIEKAKKINPGILITPTRKTLWGLLDKRACVLGGGGTHRLGLDNAVLIKHNHIKASDINMERFFERAVQKLIFQKTPARFFEIEVRNRRDGLAAAKVFGKAVENGLHTPCCIMMDNMKPSEIAGTVKAIGESGLRNHILLEASGRINGKTLAAYTKTGVDILSVGAITHSAPMLDLSMRVISPSSAGGRGK